ncbi:S-adenosyl-L-methionine-dependent methyltransferase [Schizophyllum amplum]|uniref:S-adenosyl-L-methionine-dependent methyltransferase n=1 Tax=Schizophyllum amplum TaxID=97359 RepID=A0A550CYI3_9AGAR|nr:S-adenosyl-L-methionine-dependent methyltransferase [Auriculariopsis ampla]
METIQMAIEIGAPLWYQNEEEGISALHAAAYMQNEELVQLLLKKGAIWNAADNMKNTAGDIALSFNNARIYTLIRDAGIRAEMLQSLLGSRSVEDSSSNLVIRAQDETGAGSTEEFLKSKLRYTKDAHGQEICMLKINDDEEVGVMMGWERGIMQETVKKTTAGLEGPLKVLNVGYGLGIIDGLFQSLDPPPTQHVIIEAHPDVLAHMREQGWYEKPGVKILEAKWQDVIESEDILGVGGFDVVYTDTFSEDYAQLKEFFQHLPDLLAGPESRFSFFNGLGATNPLFYDVYTHIAELHLADVGLDAQWSDVEISSEDDHWGATREYFSLPIYRLPVAVMKDLS